MNSIIVANGTLTPTPAIRSLLDNTDLIIAADGGAVHLQKLNILPHVIIGDLDSITRETRQWVESKKIPIITHPTRKDQTDTELCIDHAIEKGVTHLTLLGVTGQRMDHTLANICLLRRMADCNIQAKIVDNNNEIYLVTRELVIQGQKGDLLSIIPITEQVSGLSLRGLAYPLTNTNLSMGTSLGISNCFTGSQARVSLESGVVVVTKSRD